MSEEKPAVGSIAWRDLTVPNADQVRDFYAAVVGWRPEAVDMGDYQDFSMLDATGQAAAGVCWARGMNAMLPPQWLMYIIVANLDESIAACTSNGGSVIAGPKEMGTARYCVIRDPAGAVCALYQV